MTRQPPRLAARLASAHALVLGVGGLTLVLTAFVVAPALFREHLARTGETDPMVTEHAEEAFATSFAIALGVGTVASLLAAGLATWFLVRRVADPVVALADSADHVAAGDFHLHTPPADFAAELQRLSVAFDRMAARLAATDESRHRLLADLAHEIRTPLNTLEAYIDGIEDEVVLPTEQSWDTMRGQVRRLRRLTDDLHVVAAAEEHALDLILTQLDVAALAADAVVAAGPAYQAKDVALRLHPAPTPVYVRGDRERLAQVLANLLDNALRHTPPGGIVDLTVTADTRQTSLTVADTGSGIDPGHLEWIFERFHREDPARSVADGSGSGLGLTIARALTEE
nr:ATP-binding protein [Acidimicrobiales bacterium]